MRATIAPTDWVLRLPEGWEFLPTDEGALAELRSLLPQTFDGDPCVDPPAVLALFTALADDLKRGGVALAAWMAETYVVNAVDRRGRAVPEAEPTAKHQVVAMFTVRFGGPVESEAERPAAVPAAEPAQVELACGSAHCTVDLVAWDGIPIVEATYDVEDVAGLPLQFTGRTSDLHLANELLALFEGMANSFELLA